MVDQLSLKHSFNTYMCPLNAFTYVKACFSWEDFITFVEKVITSSDNIKWKKMAIPSNKMKENINDMLFPNPQEINSCCYKTQAADERGKIISGHFRISVWVWENHRKILLLVDQGFHALQQSFREKRGSFCSSTYIHTHLITKSVIYTHTTDKGPLPTL